MMTMMFVRRLVRVALVAVLWPAGAAAQTVEYYHLDALGSVRAVTDAAGTVIERHDYTPFGEDVNPSGSHPRQFTGKERDGETGLDYFGARYYSAKTARFTTVDPLYTWQENLTDPQRWNRYAYVRNNPLRYMDPDGRVIFDFQAFKGYLKEASHFGQEGYGYLVPTVAAIAAAGSIATDLSLATSSLKLVQGIRAGLLGSGLAEGANVAASRAAPQLPTFTNSTIEAALASSREVIARGGVQQGLRQLASHIDRGDAAFQGVAKTQAAAENLIKSILGNPARVAGGAKTVDAYNNAGQGVRLEIATGRLQGFLDAVKATR